MKHLDHLTEIPFLVQTKCSLHVYVYGSLSASRTEITLQLYFSLASLEILCCLITFCGMFGT